VRDYSVLIDALVAGYVQKMASYEHFAAIDSAKQQRIIVAAMTEFAARDYNEVSTNTIVANAGISKGLLFHYFDNKPGLYRYINAYVSAKLMREVMEHASSTAKGETADQQVEDVFETLKRITESKLAVTLNCPLETAFLTRALQSNLPPELSQDTDSAVEQSFDALDVIAAGIDTKRLKEGLSRKQAIKLIHWVVKGLADYVLTTIDTEPSARQLKRVTKETNDYLDLLRDLFYN
jgi:AcrR family transcriptional regulator